MKKLLKILAAIVAIVAIAAFLFVQTNKPVYNGKLQLNNLEHEVDIYFDEVGVPHIYAQNQHDAYTALGYLHAQDRLWQMELMRRISAGRLSEIFGADLLATDKLFLGMGIKDAMQREVVALDTNSDYYKNAVAYLNGINQYIENGATPLEFRLVGVEKEKYTLQDIYNVYGYMAFSFAIAHKTDPLFTSLHQQLGDEYMRDFEIMTEPGRTNILNHNPNKPRHTDSISVAINKIMESLPVSSFIGSNSWVLGAEKTKNNAVIFENDPHIGYSQPAVWYQSHLVTPDYEIYGFNLALTPFPLLGHNRHYAYGLTMFENDDIDFFTEPKKQISGKRTETIKVKGEPDVVFTVRSGKYGPVLNDFLEGVDSTKIITMDWIFTKRNNALLELSHAISHANNLDEFKQGASKLNAPGLNMMYGDADGNIAWLASGKLYLRKNNPNTKLLLDGSDPDSDSLRYLDFSENPKAVNPPWHYVYSANNQPDTIAGVLYPGYYLPEDRAKRIVTLIEAKNDFTKADVMKMTMDVTSSVVPDNCKNIVANVNKDALNEKEQQALAVLENWNGSYNADAVAPVVYFKFVYQMLKHAYADEIGGEQFAALLKTHFYKRQIARQIQNENSIWWDNINTPDKTENRSDIFTAALQQTVTDLSAQLGADMTQWTWNRVAKAIHKHTFDKIGALRNYFNVGPFVTDGANEVINNQIFRLDSTGVYEIFAGPSTRRVVDFSDVENSVAIIPTGQSGNVFSKHYSNQAQKYLNGEFVKMKLNKAEIEQSDDKLVLKPKK